MNVDKKENNKQLFRSSEHIQQDIINVHKDYIFTTLVTIYLNIKYILKICMPLLA